MIEESIITTIKQAKKITFLTGAGVSTASGIPDYRSLKGIYHGVMQPEYLLSDRCLRDEPDVFYQFVKKLYHPNAEPNSIHKAMKSLELTKDIKIVSQNIDGLHDKARSSQVVNFHGSLYDIYCIKCGQSVDTLAYMKSDCHNGCNGQLRPAIVLYGEGFEQAITEQAIKFVENSEVLVIVGTTFQVHPFCDLIHYCKKNTKIVVVNQTPIYLSVPFEQFQGDAGQFFEKLMHT